MRLVTSLTAAAIAAALTGCYTYPVYQPVPVARLTPAQSAALAQRQQNLTPEQRDQLAKDNAQVQRDQAQSPYASADAGTYVYPATPTYYDYPAYSYPYGGYYGGGYYGGYYGGYPWYPGISIGLGFGGYYRGGYYRGGYGYGHGGWGGGYHGGGGFRHR